MLFSITVCHEVVPTIGTPNRRWSSTPPRLEPFPWKNRVPCQHSAAL